MKPTIIERTITVKPNDGPGGKVLAYVTGQWAMHRECLFRPFVGDLAMQTDKWVVTHLPSGRKLAVKAGSKRRMRQMLLALATLRFPATRRIDPATVQKIVSRLGPVKWERHAAERIAEICRKKGRAA